MLTIYDQIQELRAELAGCILTRCERAAAQVQLNKLLAEQAILDSKFDAAIAALDDVAPPD